MATKKKTESGIVMLPITELVPHPDNPRKDLGDLTELSENIRQHGIRQNLTVVDCGNCGYRIIIGHRRHAAAKLAGLKEVPCIIADMSEREQLETMLAENLLRNDLKLSEQVRTFEQLTLDGITSEDIAKTTGFSRNYIERRLKYASALGADEIREMEERTEQNDRQLTLDEMDKLCSIKSPATRKKLSEDIGTSNFAWNFRNEKEKEINEENRAALMKKLAELGIPRIDMKSANNDYTTATRHFLDIAAFLADPLKKLAALPAEKDERFYYAIFDNTTNWFYICIGEPASGEDTKDEKPTKSQADKDREKEAELERQLDGLFAQAFRSRYEFVKEISGVQIANKFGAVMRFLCTAAMNPESIDNDFYAGLIGTYEQTDDEEDEVFIERMIKRSAANLDGRSLAFLAGAVRVAYAMYGDSEYNGIYNREYHSERLDRDRCLYAHLVDLGYVMSDEEKALIDGTHELYKNREAT